MLDKSEYSGICKDQIYLIQGKIISISHSELILFQFGIFIEKNINKKDKLKFIRSN